MWTFIIAVIAILAFGLIRGTIKANGTYKVVNKRGTPFHVGSYVECKSLAKTQNENCKTFSIDDSFVVEGYKL
jgi:hypothetical protein